MVSSSPINTVSELLRISPGSQAVNVDITDFYLQPETPNFAAADAIAVLRSTKGCTAWKIILFQMTLSSTHDVKATALHALWKALPNSLKSSCEVYLVWVVRETQSFSAQKVFGDTTEETWKKKLTQCVLRFGEAELRGS